MLRRYSLLLSFAVLGVLGVSTMATAQPPGRGPGGFGGGPRGGGLLDLLRNEEVRTELGILDDQLAPLREAEQEMRNQAREMFSGLRDLNQEEREARFAEIRAKFEGLREEMQSKIESSLLPHQVDRLRQIATQMQIQRGGASGILNDRMKESLGISDEQEEALRKAAEEAETEMRAKVAKLREEAQQKVLRVLTPEQRAKFQEMVGEPFELTQRPGFGGGFNRGGRDGSRGRGSNQRSESE